MQNREEELVADLSAAAYRRWRRDLEGLEFRKAAQELRAMWTSGNVYLNDTAPWKTLTDDWERTATVECIKTINLVRLLAVISDPFLPQQHVGSPMPLRSRPRSLDGHPAGGRGTGDHAA